MVNESLCLSKEFLHPPPHPPIHSELQKVAEGSLKGLVHLSVEWTQLGVGTGLCLGLCAVQLHAGLQDALGRHCELGKKLETQISSLSREGTENSHPTVSCP